MIDGTLQYTQIDKYGKSLLPINFCINLWLTDNFIIHHPASLTKLNVLKECMCRIIETEYQLEYDYSDTRFTLHLTLSDTTPLL